MGPAVPLLPCDLPLCPDVPVTGVPVLQGILFWCSDVKKKRQRRMM